MLLASAVSQTRALHVASSARLCLFQSLPPVCGVDCGVPVSSAMKPVQAEVNFPGVILQVRGRAGIQNTVFWLLRPFSIHFIKRSVFLSWGFNFEYYVSLKTQEVHKPFMNQGLRNDLIK